MLPTVIVLCQLLVVGMAYATTSDNDDTTNIKEQTNVALGQGHARSQDALEDERLQLQRVAQLCEWLCQRNSPLFAYGCPSSCEGGVQEQWAKRAARGRRFDDFSFGFDDYLFMKLLGRDLSERS